MRNRLENFSDAEADQKILIIDDERQVGEMLQAFLAIWGYSAVFASSETESLAIWDKEKNFISKLIIDVKLGAADGLVLARRLRTDKPDLGVVYMSGYAARDLPTGELKEGINFLAKPFQPEVLRQMLLTHDSED